MDPPDLHAPKTGRRIIKFSQPKGDGTEERTLEIHSILARDFISSIDTPVFITVEEASQNLVDRDLVVSLSFNGEHKTYSTAFLSSREVAGKELTFGVSGKLIMNAWVM